MLAATGREAARRFGHLTALVDPDGTPITFAGLDRRSDAVAAGLVARGVAPGDRVVLRLRSDSRYVVAYAAAAKAGAVTAGINPRLTAAEQAALVGLADPALVLHDPDELAELTRLGEAAVDRGAAPPGLPPDPDRPVAIVFTSGTTGMPKGAVFCERQLEAVAVTDTGGAWAPPGQAGEQRAHVDFARHGEKGRRSSRQPLRHPTEQTFHNPKAQIAVHGALSSDLIAQLLFVHGFESRPIVRWLASPHR